MLPDDSAAANTIGSRIPERAASGVIRAGAAALIAFWIAEAANADALLDRLRARSARSVPAGQEGYTDSRATLPYGVQVVRDVAYGDDAMQRFDVYTFASPASPAARGAPVIVMVHGGAWAFGDKAMSRVVGAKVARWVPRGVVFVSVNYRMLPDSVPLEQAADVARAVTAVQARAAEWGGDRDKLVLMGHSAGAHLVSLLSAKPALLAAGNASWLGTVSLDSAAFDVTELMRGRHLPLYDRAFGQNPADWQAASPTLLLSRAPPAFLAVCSTRRDDSCPQADRFAARARSFGGRAEVLRQDLSHGEINSTLGESGPYTEAVETFLRSLDGVLDRALRLRSEDPILSQ